MFPGPLRPKTKISHENFPHFPCCSSGIFSDALNCGCQHHTSDHPLVMLLTTINCLSKLPPAFKLCRSGTLGTDSAPQIVSFLREPVRPNCGNDASPDFHWLYRAPVKELGAHHQPRSPSTMHFVASASWGIFATFLSLSIQLSICGVGPSVAHPRRSTAVLYPVTRSVYLHVFTMHGTCSSR